MKKVYLILGLFIAVTVVSCGNSDTTANETTTSEEPSADGTSGELANESANPTNEMQAYANDKSKITIADLDPKDTSFTTRSKALYTSDENGKKLTVVYGLKATANGVAIIELEGEKPVSLKQVETAHGAQYEFTNGTVMLKRVDNGVQLNENGEVVSYKEVR